MSNLLKRKPKTYKKETTREEFLKQERFYKITIEDKACALESVGNPEKIVDKLFEIMPNKNVKPEIELLLGTNRYDYKVTSFGFGNDRVVEVLITSKRRCNVSLFRSRK